MNAWRGAAGPLVCEGVERRKGGGREQSFPRRSHRDRATVQDLKGAGDGGCGTFHPRSRVCLRGCAETRWSAGRCKFTGVTTPAAPPFPGHASTRLAWLRLGDLPATSPKPRTPGAACCPLAGRDVALGQLAVGARQLERSWPRFSAQILIVS